jgi:hypothetical protein
VGSPVRQEEKIGGGGGIEEGRQGEEKEWKEEKGKK